MSYYSSQRNIQPGPIEGSPVAGLCYRIVVNVERVLDSCLKQASTENTILSLSGFTPPNPNPPYKFLNAYSTQGTAIISELSIKRLEERPCFARIKCNITIPLRVTYEDSQKTIGYCDSQITLAEDIIMYVPPASVFPFEVKATASCTCPNGRYIDENTFSVTACTTVIIKICADTDLLIPTYGFCPAPKAVDFEREACTDFFDLPLYPSGKQ